MSASAIVSVGEVRAGWRAAHRPGKVVIIGSQRLKLPLQ